MNDDELRRQLERRADRGSPEWVRRGLLPAVSSATQERPPERVVGRGLSPLGALAAVAAVLVLVVGLAVVRPATTPPSAGSGSPPPEPSASSPTAARQIDCLAVRPTGEPIGVPPLGPKLLDSSGLIERCTISRLDEMGPAAARVWAARDAPRNLRVEWQGTPCDAAAVLHFSGTYDAAGLLIEYPGGDCESMGVAHGVTLYLARAVDPDDVSVRALTSTGQQGIDWAEVEAAGAAFELRILSPASTFVAGEPIEGINAELVYIGEAPEITLTGGGSLIQAFGVRQLHGPLSPGAGWNDPCEPETVRATVPYVKPFTKSGGYGNDDPNADWYRQFFDDPQLRLPAGLWEITAHSHFYVGGCAGGARLVELEASVVLEVVDEALTDATPSPSPSRIQHALDCSSVTRHSEAGTPSPSVVWLLTVEDTTDLVWGCQANADRPVVPEERIVVRPSDGDLGAQLEVVWMGDACRDEVVIRIDPFGRPGGGTRYTLEVEEIDEGINCYAAPVERSAVLLLRQPIDPLAIHASLKPSGVEPSPTTTRSPEPSPTPSLPPQPAPEAWSPCADLPLSVTDVAGIVVGCEVGSLPSFLYYEVDMQPVRNTTGDPHVVDLTYSILDPEFCRGERYELEVSPVGDATTDVPLVVVPSEHCEEWGPIDYVGRWISVRLTLNRPVGAEWVVLHEPLDDRMYRDEDATKHGMGTDFPPGRISLYLSTDRETYSASEPIPVTAELVYRPDYLQPDEPLLAYGAIPHFGFVYEQLNGDGRHWGPSPACQPIVLDPDEPLTVTSDPNVRLEPGRWRISVTASLSGSACGEDAVTLHTYVIVRVRD